MNEEVLEDKTSYKNIFKATFLFGGVQVFIILIGIFRNKAIAILLGTSGVGILGLLTAAIDLIKVSTSLGLSQSAVRDLSESLGSGDKSKLNTTIIILKRWFWATGIFGALLTLILSRSLSKWTFGNEEYTWSFIWLSIVIFLHALSSGQLAILQGMRRLQSLAKASMFGALIGLLISVPLYYYFGLSGIVPSMIFSGIVAFLISWYYTRNINTSNASINYPETIKGGAGMVRLGIAMMFVSFVITIASFILRSYINKKTGIDEVGVFQAGFIIITSYFGMIFTSLTTDYYPRISAINKDNLKVSGEVNRQAEIGMILIGPLVIVIVFMLPLLIKLLYSEKFIGAIPYVQWAVFGIIFQIGSQTMGMVLLAKNRSGIFIYTVLGFQTFFLVNNILFYNYLGLKGLGVAYSINLFIHFSGVQLLMNNLFKIRFKRRFFQILITTLFLCILAHLIKDIQINWIRFICGSILLCVSLTYSLFVTKKIMSVPSIRNWIRFKIRELKIKWK